MGSGQKQTSHCIIVLMLPRKYRLPGWRFPEVKKHGRVIHGRFFSLLVLHRKDKTGESRFGIVISKKVHKLAVKRNRVKRLLREAIKTQLTSIKSGCDCLVLVKHSALDVSVAELEKETKITFTKANLL